LRPAPALLYEEVYVYGRAHGLRSPVLFSLAAGLLVIPLVTTAGVALLTVLNILAWKKAWWSFWRRVLHSVFALAALAFVAYLNYWNLLGFRY